MSCVMNIDLFLQLLAVRSGKDPTTILSNKSKDILTITLDFYQRFMRHRPLLLYHIEFSNCKYPKPKTQK